MAAAGSPNSKLQTPPQMASLTTRQAASVSNGAAPVAEMGRMGKSRLAMAALSFCRRFQGASPSSISYTGFNLECPAALVATGPCLTEASQQLLARVLQCCDTCLWRCLMFLVAAFGGAAGQMTCAATSIGLHSFARELSTQNAPWSQLCISCGELQSASHWLRWASAKEPHEETQFELTYDLRNGV
jgi:hypothetical protein